TLEHDHCATAAHDAEEEIVAKSLKGNLKPKSVAIERKCLRRVFHNEERRDAGNFWSRHMYVLQAGLPPNGLPLSRARRTPRSDDDSPRTVCSDRAARVRCSRGLGDRGLRIKSHRYDDEDGHRLAIPLSWRVTPFTHRRENRDVKIRISRTQNCGVEDFPPLSDYRLSNYGAEISHSPPSFFSEFGMSLAKKFWAIDTLTNSDYARVTSFIRSSGFFKRPAPLRSWTSQRRGGNRRQDNDRRYRHQ